VMSSFILSRIAVTCACVDGFEMVNDERSSTRLGLNVNKAERWRQKYEEPDRTKIFAHISPFYISLVSSHGWRRQTHGHVEIVHDSSPPFAEGELRSSNET
jgi:hypothetical protein